MTLVKSERVTHSVTSNESDTSRVYTLAIPIAKVRAIKVTFD